MTQEYNKFDEIWIPETWKNKINVEDNLLPITHFNHIESYVTGNKFPWAYGDNITTGFDNSPDTIDNYNFGYSSNVFDNILINEQGQKTLKHPQSTAKKIGLLPADFVSFLSPLLFFVKDHIGFDMATRARFDMTTRTPNKEYFHKPHVDYDSSHPHISCIIYMNDSDGDTIIFNETSKNYTNNELDNISINDLTIKERIHPKRGRVLLFDGSFIHTGSSPYNNRNRILLNSNFINLPKKR
tara:strand:+ start:259 stop:981 length:723 start_codon:yes stop_codon:yes gene_type:complete